MKAFDPSAVIDGIIIEQQKKKGLEILVGGRIDPTFGKVLTIGMGGTLVELIRDVSLRILPVSHEDIDAMIQELKGYPLIKGFRNEPPRDKKGLIALIDTVARFFIEQSTMSWNLISIRYFYMKKEYVLSMPGSM